MQQSAEINIGNSAINHYTIQSNYEEAKQQQKTFQMLNNTFSVLDMVRNNKEKHKEEIESIVKSNMLSPIDSGKYPRSTIDFNAKHPLIKEGGIGTLQRHCQITDKGLLQNEDKKQPHLKTVVGFLNKIQRYGSKDNEKIQWLKDNKQYPFRIIVQGDKKQPKAIFFRDKKTADNVRLFYVEKFNYKGNFNKVMRQAQQKYSQSVVQNFKYSIIMSEAQKKKKKLQVRQSKMNERSFRSNQDNFPTENLPAMSSQNKSFNKEDPIDRILGRSSNPKSQAYEPKTMDYLISRQDQRLSSKTAAKSKVNFGAILKLEKFYSRHFFQSWLQKAKEVSANRSKINQSLAGKSYISDLQKHRSSLKSNPNNQFLSADKSLSKSKHESYHYEKKVCFTNIQFLKLTNTLIKPIVSLFLVQSQKKQYECVFNTMIRSKTPHLCYELIPSSGEASHILRNDIKKYQIQIRVIDYLTNQQICDDIIPLNNKVFSHYTLLLNAQKTVRIEMRYDHEQFATSEKHSRLDDNPEGSFLQILPFKERDVEKIRKYWEEQSIRKGYYNVSKDIKILQILELTEQIPVSWSVGLNEEQYKIIHYLAAASKILGFKMIPSILQIIRVLQKIYSEVEELVEACLSIITHQLSTYYYPEQFNKTQQLHKVVGLEGDIEFSSKIWLELAIMRKLVKIEAPDIEDRMTRKNIAYHYLLYEYIYKVYAKVFPIKTLIQIWNFCFRDSTNIRIYLILIAVWLMKFYGQKIIKCRRFRQLSEVFQSQQTCSSEIIIKELLVLRQKYFRSPNKSLIEQIKGFFDQKPLQQVAVQFYKRQTARMDNRKQTREVEKEAVLQKLNKQLDIELPSYPLKRYCFHIYFYRLPIVPGSLNIKANDIEYECLNFTKNSYFILGEVGTEISLEFINNKSNQFTAKIQLVLGINKFRIELTSPKQKNSYQVQYLCGLLTESHIQALKKNRRFQNYIASFMNKEQLFDEFLRPVNESHFLNSYTKRLQKQDLGKKIKIIFSSGNKNFDEVQFYLRWIASSPLSIQEKIKLVKQYAQNISYQYYLSHNRQLEKIFISEFVNMIQFPVSPLEFECFYADSIQSEFKAAKLLKCRLFLPSGKQFKLQKTALQYYIKRTKQTLYGDLIISQLLQKISHAVEGQLSNISEATLSLLYSSNGEVYHIEIPVIRKKSSKQLILDQQKYELDNPSERGNIEQLEPQILVTQILPTFSKISSILDFVHHSQAKSTEKFQKYHREKDSEQKKIPENLNLLKICNRKLANVILMRYLNYPEKIKIPFLSYFHDLTYDLKIPHFPKNIYLNNTKTDLRTICCIKGQLNFSDSKRPQAISFNKNDGLYANLRFLPPQTDVLYFTTFLNDEKKEKNFNAFLFINYGYGIYRWQPCQVLGYSYLVNEKQSRLKQQRKPKKNYLVKYEQKQQYYREVQLQIDPLIQDRLEQLGSTNRQNMIIRDNMSSKAPKSVGLSKLLASNF